jgi:hypothetical protein
MSLDEAQISIDEQFFSSLEQTDVIEDDVHSFAGTALEMLYDHSGYGLFILIHIFLPSFKQLFMGQRALLLRFLDGIWGGGLIGGRLDFITLGFLLVFELIFVGFIDGARNNLDLSLLGLLFAHF